ncbi:MAG: peptide MFS transporter [Terrisporobacter sp.]|uniref:peptide MFS transporter n=1 Tax=Terrisporobacter sp. TaxID=1965305 RepID=UPI002FC6F0C6
MDNTVKTKKKYPKGFYICALSFTFERMAFYSAKWLIALFVVKTLAEGGLGLTDADGAKMSANLVAFTYLTPIFGGWIADRWLSPRICVPLGTLLMGLGYLCGWQSAIQGSVGMLWLMIALVSIGTGFFKGNISAINGRLFEDQTQLDSAFTIQYSFVNIGSFIGTTFVSFIAYGAGFGPTFLVCALILFLDTIWLIFGGKAYFGEIGKKPFKINETNIQTEKDKQKSDDEPLTKKEKLRVGAIILVTLFSVIFWVVWYLTYMPIMYHWGPDFDTANKANWVIGNFTVPSSWFDSLNALCCIFMGPLLAVVWSKKANSPKGDLSMFKKTALGMLLLGVAFMVMATAEIVRGAGQASLMWIVMVGLLMSLGEMVFSPLGNSFISKFSPPRLLGLMMGVWPFAIFIAAKCYGYLYEYLAKYSFAPAYGIVGAIVLICGVVLWSMDKRFNKLVE